MINKVKVINTLSHYALYGILTYYTMYGIFTHFLQRLGLQPAERRTPETSPYINAILHECV